MSVWLDRAGSRTDAGPQVQVINSLTQLPVLMAARTEQGA
jgi:hypothetical protein